MVGAIPLVGKTKIKKKTPEKRVTFTEPEPKRPKITIKSSQTVGVESAKEKNVAEKDVAKADEAQRKAEERRKKIEEEKKRKAEEDRRSEEAKRKKAEEEKRAEEAKRKKASDVEKEREQKKAMEKPINDPEFEITKGPERRKEPEVAKPTHPAHTEVLDRTNIVSTKGSGRYVSSGASSGGAGGYNPQVIGAKDTLGDIYYKSYTEEDRGSAPHQAPWGLKQRDTFQEFRPFRDWFLNSFTPGEVNRQKAKTHESLYRTYVIEEANTRAANHQIVREWRTMVRERADWESYRERMLKRISDFEKSKAAFDEEKAKFDADKKAEEWGREGLKNKLQVAEQQLAKEKAEFKRICEKDNERAFAARNKIVELEAKIVELTAKVEDAQAEKVAKQQIEVELADVKLQLSSKDKDLQAKDVEIAELKRRLNDQIDRCESLEIDLEAEKVKAATAEEARAVSTAALNVAQTDYSEAQGIVDTLVSEADWMSSRGVVLVANSILNAGELDRTVAALTDDARAVGHRGGYLECALHVEEVFGQEFDVSHCSVTDQANAELTRAESSYNNLTLPVMDLVVEALKKDDWCQRLKAILDPPITVELSDEEEPAGDDGGNGDDDGGNDDDGDDDGDQRDELE
ncbi:caldesmon-like [Helianthus annuus]|uniref:caldesmon-like n=1 Tax=Helianthus annuus TaxID=4232 RepID=UPI000B8FB655|nr:caldesmon-like [Helianthus annuus]